ncbi:hypothetical protein GLOTRDRAFT_124315 [Gloeophyllum trabeum ATCC 11539]|uniref:Uncharacterized protein n=1 Tax=Gloeophyllum trabeum (strain ATCC 11539 / FP-39264 / Madison 617) TaxID=670483 RepID=S7QLX1_GLOTA|nr:uncharacterized protein GLOTRDRAFT_124315 [Gloeophyllum trabeum ATCC 11539]EPQ60556.1 hypothetical protein GLOTRDRAFT_124315 [Gloeophyllum trabeum ATCC 11539]
MVKALNYRSGVVRLGDGDDAPLEGLEAKKLRSKAYALKYAHPAKRPHAGSSSARVLQPISNRILPRSRKTGGRHRPIKVKPLDEEEEASETRPFVISEEPEDISSPRTDFDHRDVHDKDAGCQKVVERPRPATEQLLDALKLRVETAAHDWAEKHERLAICQAAACPPTPRARLGLDNLVARLEEAERIVAARKAKAAAAASASRSGKRKTLSSSVSDKAHSSGCFGCSFSVAGIRHFHFMKGLTKVDGPRPAGPPSESTNGVPSTSKLPRRDSKTFWRTSGPASACTSNLTCGLTVSGKNALVSAENVLVTGTSRIADRNQESLPEVENTTKSTSTNTATTRLPVRRPALAPKLVNVQVPVPTAIQKTDKPLVPPPPKGVHILPRIFKDARPTRAYMLYPQAYLDQTRTTPLSQILHKSQPRSNVKPADSTQEPTPTLPASPSMPGSFPDVVQDTRGKMNDSLPNVSPPVLGMFQSVVKSWQAVWRAAFGTRG